MKKSKIFLFAMLLYSLCGCSAFPTVASPDGKEVSQDEGANDTDPSSDTDYERIETMKGWSFQYNHGTDDYSLLPYTPFDRHTERMV